jgi:sodium transport system permease protein
MRTVLTVFSKEVVDNFRDRRTLVTALLMGPLLGPMLFAFVISLSIERSLSDADSTMQLPVIGAEHAPNLTRFLQSRSIEVVAGPVDRDAALDGVKKGELDVVVLIPAEFGEQLREGSPARIELISDQANAEAALWFHPF